MKMNNVGIDYGLGKANIDKENRIRYGVIERNSFSADVYTDILTEGTNISYEGYMRETSEEIRGKLEEVLMDYFDGEDFDYIINDIGEIIEDFLSENYIEDDDCYLYEKDGYVIETTDLGLYVLKSPFITYTRFCSPCCPGAGDLGSPIEGGVPTYCLGEDWFDEYSPCPYKIYKTEDYLIGDKHDYNTVQDFFEDLISKYINVGG